ncbi:MAG: MarR family winged helix-turn-helix transcriptional regulator [Lachnospiraceae bacterium]|nr:MarR family winged helix-turn-helix transcriptional regulator [Lachnospiraceae bacterium]
MKQYNEVCSKIREFNRFYTVQMELLSSNYLGSPYSVTETRILFELWSHRGCQQSEIVRTLHIDKSYLSRIMRRFCAKGLVEKSRTGSDKRVENLFLTQFGNAETERLIELTNQRILAQIKNLGEEECDQLSAALDTVISVLGRRAGEE